MARIRTIKPEFWQDERLGTLPVYARLLFIGLWNIADDKGRLRGSPLFIRAQVFPYDHDIDVQAGLDLLEKAGRITRYVHDLESYIWVRKFEDHQRIDKPKVSTLPAPPRVRAEPEPVEGRIQDASGKNPPTDGTSAEIGCLEGKGMEGKGKEGSGREAAPAAGATLVIPTSDPDTWQGKDYWAWAQGRRQAAGLIPEKPPRHEKLSAWWSSVLMTEGVTVHALREAFYRFGDDKHWSSRDRDPPCPFAGFMSQWEKFTRAEVADGAAA
jgi:hypothetical protein